MRLLPGAHTAHRWRIHELTGDFRLEDVWALPTRGGPDDFARLVELATTTDPERQSPLPVRMLWALRWKLGERFGWDDESDGVGARVPSLRERMPDDLRDAPRGPVNPSLPFRPLYLLKNEFAAEIANHTVHGVMHLGWVPGGDGGFRGQMAVLVKPNGLFGEAYMAAIKPFRHLLVYPPMLREFGRRWSEGDEPEPPG